MYATKLEGHPNLIEDTAQDLMNALQAITPSTPLAAQIPGEVTLIARHPLQVGTEVQGVLATRCFSCKRISLWAGRRVVHPPNLVDPQRVPNLDLAGAIQQDFNEAAAILNTSPRGAAALLRLCVQKLCVQLGQPGKNLNEDIGALVSKGLDIHIKEALDVVRVVGNDCVHPGEIDYRDDKATASVLFDLVNEIAESLISKPARIRSLHERVVSPSVLRAIDKRDKKP